MKVFKKHIYVIALILFIVAIYTLRNRISNFDSLNAVIYSTCLLIPALVGTQILLVTGYFDLSTGSIVALTGLLTTDVYLKTHSLFLGILSAISIGALIGLFNGLLVIKLRIHSLIVTIASTSIITGISLFISNGSVLIGLPDKFQYLSQGEFLRVPFPIFFGTFFCLITYLLSDYLLTFRRFYQVGSNSIAAKACGIKVDYFVCLGFIFSAIGGAVAGIFDVSRTMAATPQSNNTLSLDLIAASVIGGTSLIGGKGNIVGALFGLFLMQGIEFIVILVGLNIYWRYLFIGALIILITAANTKFSNLKTKIS